MSREADDPNELPSMGPRPPTVVNNQQNQNPSQQQVQTREAKPEDAPQGPVVTREQKIEITEEKQNAQENPSEDSESESDNTDATDEDKNIKPAKQSKTSDEEDESSGDEDDKDTESSGDDDDKSDDE